MSEKEKQVLGNLEKMVPNMTEVEMARLVGYGEGLAARENRAGEPENIQPALAGGQNAV